MILVLVWYCVVCYRWWWLRCWGYRFCWIGCWCLVVLIMCCWCYSVLLYWLWYCCFDVVLFGCWWDRYSFRCCFVSVCCRWWFIFYIVLVGFMLWIVWWCGLEGRLVCFDYLYWWFFVLMCLEIGLVFWWFCLRFLV